MGTQEFVPFPEAREGRSAGAAAILRTLRGLCVEPHRQDPFAAHSSASRWKL